MSQIVVGEEVVSQLNGFRGANEVVDDSGKLLGYLIDPDAYEKYLDAWEKDHAEELAEYDRRLSDGKVGTLEELWKELGAQ